MSQTHDDNAVIRKMRVVKMRGHAHLEGSHTFRITGDGLRIYPRILPPLPDDRFPGAAVDREPRRIPTGVPGLDDLMHGGLPQGHTLLVSGPTGVGKTILCTRFLQAGAERGEKGVAVCFEKGVARLRNAQLAEMVNAGQVTIVESRSLSLTVEALLDDVTEAIERTGATRVVIDSVSELGLYLAPEFRANLRLTMFRTLSVLAKRGVSAVVTIGLEDNFNELVFSHDELSFLTDSVLAMRYAEVEGALRSFMTVVKVRGIDHCRELREYRITDQGIEVEPAATEFDGVLTGGHTRRRTGK
jgi:circadian clock protein KaiC